MFDLKHQVCPGFVEGQDPDVAELGPSLYKEYALSVVLKHKKIK